jgi:hypothetical protein
MDEAPRGSTVLFRKVGLTAYAGRRNKMNNTRIKSEHKLLDNMV